MLLEARERQTQRGEHGLQRAAEGRYERRGIILQVMVVCCEHGDLHAVEQRVDGIVLALDEGGGEEAAPVAQQTREAALFDGGLVHTTQ